MAADLEKMSASEPDASRRTPPLVVHVLLLSRLGRNDGGRETWLYNFVPRLVLLEKRLRVRVFGICDAPGDSVTEELGTTVGDDEAERFTAHQFVVAKRPYSVFFQMWSDIVAHTRSPGFVEPDVVLAMGTFELVMLATGRYRRSRKVVWLRSIFLHEKAGRFPAVLLPVFQRLEAALLRRVDRVLSIGDDIADHYRAQGVTVDVVENGVDLARWGGLPTPHLGEPIHVAFIGRLAQVKGIEEFVAAVRLVKSGPMARHFVFHVVGEGPCSRAPWFTQASDLFEFHGPIPNVDLPAFLAKVDVCVALTWARETGGGGGTSNALLEQMAAGRVIVAWDSRIFRQVLNDDAAYFVPQGDVDKLADAFLAIRATPQEAEKRAERALERAGDYAMDTKALRCLSLLTETLSGPPERSPSDASTTT